MHIQLDGNDWQFKAYYGEDWRWRDAHKPVTQDMYSWHHGTVPGSVHNDLWALDEIPDPYFGRNSLLLEWIPARTWLYKKSFPVGQELGEQRIQLCFDGVDYEAQFYLNGILLGHHCSMFTPAVFEVTDLLQYRADNILAVVIEASPHEQPQVSRTSKVVTHKSRMTYWWDFCPRMIHIGIWDSVYLNVTGSIRIEDVFVRPQLAPDHQQAAISITTILDAVCEQACELAITLRLNGDIVASVKTDHILSRGETALQTDICVDDPELWWPNGYGEQPLYEAEVSVLPAGTKSDAIESDDQHDHRTVIFGIRSCALIPNETSDATALPYTFVVNGRKIYVKGWNWVPIDVLYGVERPEKLERLLTLASDANVNLLRIWGGGLVEKQSFYDQCDQLGIMVWQEFIQSSSGIENYPSDDPAYIELMVHEAEQIIPRKRNHASLVLWCGGNELSDGPESPLDNSHPLLAELKAVVTRLDPDRHWLPTSPTGRVFLNSRENIQCDPDSLHDVHGPWEYQGVDGQYELYNRSTSLLHSEFGVEGITNLKTLMATTTPEQLWPATLDNPVWHHRGAWWNQHAMWQRTFGDITDIHTLTRATQYIQASGLSYAVEADRRRKYQNSGTLPWQFNEPYPNATGTSAVDYYAQPKPVYYAVKDAYETVHVSAKFDSAVCDSRDEFEAEIWVNSSYESIITTATLKVSLVGASGHIYADWTADISIPENSATLLKKIQYPLGKVGETVFFLDILLRNAEREQLSSNRYAFTKAGNLAPLLTVQKTALDIKLEARQDNWHLSVLNSGDQTAMYVWLEDARDLDAAGYVYFDTNYFCLVPGESLTILTRWHNIPAPDRRLTVGAWNTERHLIS